MLVVGLAALPACFPEETGSKEAAAGVLVDSLAAFADIQANLTTDPALAGEALTKFVRTPLAIAELLDQPFDLPASSAIARATAAPPADIPACLDTTGVKGCDSFTTNAECVAGPFAFTGTASRTCMTCGTATGPCDYAFAIDLRYTPPDLVMVLHTETRAPLRVDARNIQVDALFDFEITLETYAAKGVGRACTCGPLVRDANNAPVSSSVVVKNVGGDRRCARVTFDAKGRTSLLFGQEGTKKNAACACADGATCAGAI